MENVDWAGKYTEFDLVIDTKVACKYFNGPSYCCSNISPSSDHAEHMFPSASIRA